MACPPADGPRGLARWRKESAFAMLGELGVDFDRRWLESRILLDLDPMIVLKCCKLFCIEVLNCALGNFTLARLD